MKVFLGGTCNESKWRESLIRFLTIDYFNPVVEDWTEECQEEELRQRESCDFCLYILTPKMTGAYAIAEVVDDSNKRPEKTVFCFLVSDGEDKFTVGQVKSLRMVSKMVEGNRATVFNDLASVVTFLNNQS